MERMVGPLLLGVDFGHLPHDDKVFEGARETKYTTKSNTGVAGVAPSWKIMDVLNIPKLAEDRAMDDDARRKQEEENPDSFVLDAARADDSLTFTQQDFESDLRKVTRRVEPSESDKGMK